KSQIQKISLKHVEGPALDFQPKTETQYSSEVRLNPGMNRFVVTVTDINGQNFQTDTLRMNYRPDNRPQPRIRLKKSEDKLLITGQANDPLKQAVTYLWQNQNTNPFPISGVDGQTESSFTVDLPKLPGDYSIKLTVKSASGYENSVVNFFTITVDSQFVLPDLKIVPDWVANAQIYCLFFRSFTPSGTISAAISQLGWIKKMGFNVIWVLPVTDVEGVIDQGTNIGYNIIDFYRVEPYYGSNEDFKLFVRKAHEIGLRVILDVTPNHSSRSHAIALDVRSKQKYSRFYDFYQHETIPHNTNGLNQSISNEGIVYYSGFSDAILNWNWADEEARTYMLEVYKHWLLEYDIDGYRFDVYWGPHRRYGRGNFDQPLRKALKMAKSDILLLAETDGTGGGTEVIYADRDGGVDLGYDWKLKGTILTFPSISGLNLQLYNDGYRPGPNSYFLRFLENQDEDRVAYRYQSIEKTMPVATAIFMSTGIPQIYQGQEVGMGYNMSAGGRDARVRSTVNWQNAPGQILIPHYQKIAQIRAQFPAFRRQMEDVNGDGQITSQDPSRQVKLTTTSNLIYAFGRPFADQNGIVIINFGDKSQTFDLTTGLESWAEFNAGFKAETMYYFNDLYNQTSQIMSGANLKSLNLTLAPYATAIYTVSLTADKVALPDLLVGVNTEKNIELNDDFKLYTNYPNPFNPSTHIRYQLARPVQVKVEIFNLLGQKLITLVDENQTPGIYEVLWNGLDQAGKPVGSGIYFSHIEAGEFISKQKMLLIR
ncbi:T9SS type A sorting domain-containing protein, partial [candidate division KSB1 bacterium]|nr:T9SS type A sorting domain-containing protein [candidate division KSB1 bacterium]